MRRVEAFMQERCTLTLWMDDSHNIQYCMSGTSSFTCHIMDRLHSGCVGLTKARPDKRENERVRGKRKKEADAFDTRTHTDYTQHLLGPQNEQQMKEFQYCLNDRKILRTSRLEREWMATQQSVQVHVWQRWGSCEIERATPRCTAEKITWKGRASGERINDRTDTHRVSINTVNVQTICPIVSAGGQTSPVFVCRAPCVDVAVT